MNEYSKEKFIALKTPEGYVWKISREVVARSRAKNYADDPDSSYQEEFDFTMQDDSVAADWLGGNMDWEDIEDFAILIDHPNEIEVPVLGRDSPEFFEY